MKLLLDSIKVLLGVVVSLLVLMTVLAAGAKLKSYIQQVDAAARCSIRECEDAVTTHQQAFDTAAAAYQHAVDDAQRAFQAQKTALEAQIDTAADSIRAHQQERDAYLQRNGRLFDDLGLPRSFEVVAPEARVTQVVQLCQRSTEWDARRCQRIFEAATREPPTDTSAWNQAIQVAVRGACSPGMADPVLQIQSWLWVCQQKQAKLAASMTSYATLIAAGEAWKRADDAMTRADQEKDAAEAQLRALLEAPPVTAAVSEAKALKEAAAKELDVARGHLRDAQEDPWRVAKVVLDTYWSWIRGFFWTAVVLLLLGLLSRPFAYFVLAPMIRLTGTLHIVPPSSSTDVVEDTTTGVVRSSTGAQGATLILEPGVRQQQVLLAPDDALWVRPEYVTSSQGGRSIFLYGGWRHPFTSYAVGLAGMTAFQGATRSKVAIGGTGSDHTDEYIGVIRLTNHPGFVVRPQHIVAVQGELRLMFRWRFSLVALLRGQVRYVVAYGTGALFVRGYGGVFPQAVGDPTPGRAAMVPRDQLHDGLIVGWDARLGVSLERNENWIHVAWLQRGEMFETSLHGEGGYMQSHSDAPSGGVTSGVSRLFDAVLGAIGKVLGL